MLLILVESHSLQRYRCVGKKPYLLNSVDGLYEGEKRGNHSVQLSLNVSNQMDYLSDLGLICEKYTPRFRGCHSKIAI